MSCATVPVDTDAHIAKWIELTHFAGNDLAIRILHGPDHVLLSVLASEKDGHRTGFEFWLTYAAELRLPVVLYCGCIDRLVHNIFPFRRRRLHCGLRGLELYRRIGCRSLNRLSRNCRAHCA